MVVSRSSFPSKALTHFQQKISVLQHSPSTRLPGRPGDPAPTARNLNPQMHPFARARERVRALNAAKMDRIFAKPFVDSLEGHVDAVEVIIKKPGSLTTIASGSWDGGMCMLLGLNILVSYTQGGFQVSSCMTYHCGCGCFGYQPLTRARCRVYVLARRIDCSVVVWIEA
jgi:hypothetical protein